MSESNLRVFSTVDRLIFQFDRTLRTLSKDSQVVARPSPAGGVVEGDLSALDVRHAAGLMRVNHSGEVCAQALYQGQALTAKLEHVRKEMEAAANEEIDHLAWCQERLVQLNSHTSLLNPLWYGLSFCLGAGAGCISDKVSLGFVAATEDQVCKHLETHLKELPDQDAKSRVIVEEMLVDEYRHGQNALSAGGYRFPSLVKAAMNIMSKLMTMSSYRL